jgi:hypothetical protein
MPMFGFKQLAIHYFEVMRYLIAVRLVFIMPMFGFK